MAEETDSKVRTPAPSSMRMEPVTFMGQQVNPHSVEGYGPIPQGMFEAAGRSVMTNWMRVENRWAGVRDFVSGDKETVPFDQHEELVGEREIEHDRDRSLNELQREISIYDRDEYAQQFQSRPVAEFFGAIPPYILDPTTAATFPVGAANFTKAVGANAWSTFLRESAVGGAKLGVATAPLEAGVQQVTRGEIDGAELAAASLGSVVAPAVLGAPMRAIRSLGRGGDGGTARSVAENPTLRSDTDPGEVAGRLAEDTDAPAPPMTPRTERPRPTRTLMDRDFEDYPGGSRQFFRDAAVRAPQAEQKATELGIDLDDELLQQAVREIGEATDVRSRMPSDYNAALLQDLRNPTPEARSRLQQNGLLGPDDNPRPQFEALTNAAMKDPAERTVDEVALVDEFIENGLAPARKRAAEPLNREISELQEQLRGLRDVTRGTNKRTKRLNQARQQAGQVRNRLLSRMIQRDNLMAGPRVVDDGIPDERLLEILEHARLEREPGPDPVRMDVDAEPEQLASLTERLRAEAPGPAAVDGELESWAKEAAARFGDEGEDVQARLDEINEVLNEADASTRRCRIG